MLRQQKTQKLMFGSISHLGGGVMGNLAREDGGHGAVSSSFAQQAWAGRRMNSPLELY
eukprot:CAMPEP_0181318484 /NCGR_PEP_ID=MMETSP1101-20121128/17028_1 /TAXON_ID=46948 /ORGANISM="Rhodomonas abbreviata, Strain Caron Lab Isolate" /LENGTH=57 /DNA_ID=CAMNT_0023425951 /DNA_START=35 /DNA_END=208 /DNA_ORIENTATION=-